MDEEDRNRAAMIQPGLDAILRDATREFDAPVALLSRAEPPDEGPARRAYASAAVVSTSGRHLGTLCILGVPAAGAPDQVKLARLHELAARTAAVIGDRAVG